MRLITPEAGDPYYILDAPPDWSPGMETDFAVRSRIERGLSGRELRQAGGLSLILTRYALQLELTGQHLRDWLTARRDPDLLRRTIWLPFWPGQFVPGAARFISTHYFTIPEDGDWDALAIYEWAAAPEETTWVRVPLVRCRLQRQPRAVAVTDEWIDLRLELVDASTAAEALTVVATELTTGPTVAGRTLPVFPIPADWSSGLESGTTTVEADYDQFGDRRQQAQVLYPQLPAATLSLQVSGDQAEAAALLQLYAEARGSSRPFWSPTYVATERLGYDAKTGDEELRLVGYQEPEVPMDEDVARILAAWTSAGRTPEPMEIGAIIAFVETLKLSGIWDRITQLLVPLSGTAADVHDWRGLHHATIVGTIAQGRTGVASLSTGSNTSTSYIDLVTNYYDQGLRKYDMCVGIYVNHDAFSSAQRYFQYASCGVSGSGSALMSFHVTGAGGSAFRKYDAYFSSSTSSPYAYNVSSASAAGDVPLLVKIA